MLAWKRRGSELYKGGTTPDEEGLSMEGTPTDADHAPGTARLPPRGRTPQRELKPGKAQPPLLELGPPVSREVSPDFE